MDYAHGNNQSGYENISEHIDFDNYVTDWQMMPISEYTLRDYDLFISIRPSSAFTTEEAAHLEKFVRGGGGVVLIVGNNPDVANGAVNFTSMHTSNIAYQGNSETTANVYPTPLNNGINYLYMNYEVTDKVVIDHSDEAVVHAEDSAGDQSVIVSEVLGNGYGEVLVIPHGILNWPAISLYDNEKLASNFLDYIMSNLAPEAVLNNLSENYLPGDVVELDAYESWDPDGYIANYTWIIDNDIEYYGPVLSLVFQDHGEHYLELVVKDNDGTENTTTGMIYITVPPIVNIESDLAPGGSVATFVDITFSASMVQGDGEVQELTWHMGDGTRITDSNTVVHSYDEPGTYMVNLTLVDQYGLVASDAITVTINDRPPDAVFYFNVSTTLDPEGERYNTSKDDFGNYKIYEDQLIMLDGSPSTDMDTPSSKLNFTWDFGDGNVVYGEKAQYHYTTIGNYKISLVLRDDHGLQDTKSVTFNVINPAPEVEVAYDRPNGREIFVKIVHMTDTPSDRDNLSVKWELGDGHVVENKTKVRHTYASDGTYEVVLTVSDDEGAYNRTTLTITLGEPVFRDYTPYVQGLLIVAIAAIILSWFYEYYKKGREGKGKQDEEDEREGGGDKLDRSERRKRGGKGGRSEKHPGGRGGTARDQITRRVKKKYNKCQK